MRTTIGRRSAQGLGTIARAEDAGPLRSRWTAGRRGLSEVRRGGPGGVVAGFCRWLALLVLLAISFVSVDARAQTVSPGAPPLPPVTGLELDVYVVTFGPGDHPFFKFGHNAIWIRNRKNRLEGIYNYGTFAFGDPALIPKFVLGRFEYWLSRSGSIARVRNAYKRENRTVEIQELNLPPEKKKFLYEYLENNLKPENRYYKYDYYRDNCSTRVRDALDAALDGKLKEALTARPAQFTYREHTKRLTYDLLWEYVTLHLAMGDVIDQPITEWEEGFLPGVLQQSLRTMTIEGANGEQVPLVKREEILEAANRPAELEAPPSWLAYFIAIGLAIGAAFYGLGRAAARSGVARAGFGLLLMFFGFLFGFLGTFFLFAWFFTDHEVGYGNENILQCAPWLFALLVFGVGVIRGKKKSTERAYKVVLAAAALSLLGFVLQVLPWFDQQNGEILALTMPLWIGITLGLRSLHTSLPEPSPPANKKKKPASSASKKKPASADGEKASKPSDSDDKTSKRDLDADPPGPDAKTPS